MCGQRLPSGQDVKRQDHSATKNDRQPHNTLEPCRGARIVPTSDSQVVPTNKEYQRSPMVRGETVFIAFSGAKAVQFKRLSSSNKYTTY